MAPGRLLLEDLPLEILHFVCQFVPRAECPSLARTSQRFFSVAIPRIWGVSLCEVDLFGIFPGAVTVNERGRKVLAPYTSDTSCIERYFPRFTLYAQHVKGVIFNLIDDPYSTDVDEHRKWLDWVLDYTSARPYHSKLRIICLFVDRSLDDSHNYPLSCLSWLGFLMLPSLEYLGFIPKPNATNTEEAAIGLLKYTFSMMLHRCEHLQRASIPTSLLSLANVMDISRLSHLETLALIGCLGEDEHEIFSAARFTSESFPSLRELEFQTDVFEVVPCLWNTPVVAQLTHLVIAVVEQLDDDDVMTLFQLVVTQSPHLNALSIPYPSAGFQLSLLDTLSPLELRKLALTRNQTGPYEKHSDIFRLIGMRWPNLEFLAAPFRVDFDDLLGVSLHLPLLHHLSVGLPFDNLKELTLPTETVWKALPKHALVLWTNSIVHRVFKNDLMQDENDLGTLTRLLALAWPNMRLFIKGNHKYFEELRREIAVKSQEMFESDVDIDSLHDSHGLVTSDSFSAHIDESGSGLCGVLSNFE